MKLSIGIVGLPNVGKSTLFNILTKQKVNTANYPFATIDPNIGIVPVPDERLNKISKLSKAEKTVPTVIEFVDIAGLVKDAHKGEGLGNQFLAHIRETQAIVIILRLFENPEVAHIENSIDPLRDLETINTELILKDLETAEKQLGSLEPKTRGGDKQTAANRDNLVKIKKHLESGNLLSVSEQITSLIRTNRRITELNFLTLKKQLYLLNKKEGGVDSELIEKIKGLGADYIVADLSKAQGIPELIKKSYEILDLISFFTITGTNETRAWTIKKGTRAKEAAGQVHTDFEKNFIRAEVINWQKLLEAGSWNNAKHKGQVRLEGKEYIVQDGDVLLIRHS